MYEAPCCAQVLGALDEPQICCVRFVPRHRIYTPATTAGTARGASQLAGAGPAAQRASPVVACGWLPVLPARAALPARTATPALICSIPVWYRLHALLVLLFAVWLAEQLLARRHLQDPRPPARCHPVLPRPAARRCPTGADQTWSSPLPAGRMPLSRGSYSVRGCRQASAPSMCSGRTYFALPTGREQTAKFSSVANEQPANRSDFPHGVCQVVQAQEYGR